MGKVDLALEVVGEQGTIQFTTGAGNPVNLTHVRKGELIGTIALRATVSGSAFRQMQLKKVD